MATLFRENRRHGTDGQTDRRVQHLTRPPSEGRIIMINVRLLHKPKWAEFAALSLSILRNIVASIRG